MFSVGELCSSETLDYSLPGFCEAKFICLVIMVALFSLSLSFSQFSFLCVYVSLGTMGTEYSPPAGSCISFKQ